MYRIVEGDLDPGAALAAVKDPSCGAVAAFVGTVRGERDGRRVLRLEYEVLEPLALAEFARIGEALRARHGVAGVAILHRRGVVPVGGVSVAIAVAAPHRAAALAACAEAIERLKRDAAIWKKEVYPDGHRWLEGS